MVARVLTAVTVLAGALAAAPAALAAPPEKPPAPGAAPTARENRASVLEADRDRVLPNDWRNSADRAVTTDGDSTGLHVLTADAKDGYTWRTAATLAEPGIETDQWVGQQCVTGSGRYAAVVYAPRQAVNHEEAFRSGGFSAIVDLVTGDVRKLPLLVSLAYYNPGCGADDNVVLTQNFFAVDKYVSRLTTVDAATGSVVRKVDAKGQVTSAVPYRDTTIVAARGGLSSVDEKGTLHRIAEAADTPFRLGVDKAGGIGYEVRTISHTEIHRYTVAGDTTVAIVPVDSVQLHQVGGQVFVQGSGVGKDFAATVLPGSWQAADVASAAQMSTTGALAITGSTNVKGSAGDKPVASTPGSPLAVTITAKVMATGAQPSFSVQPQALKLAAGITPSPVAFGSQGVPKGGMKVTEDLSTVTTDNNAKCQVLRNDPKIQSLQPTPEMSEWAADLAVKGQLNIQRPANWNGSTLPAYSPQGLFPPRALVGGGQVPAQVLLGIMAQESNMWQAGPTTTDGESGNFNQGGFYGRNVGVDSVNFSTADCGYGATQVTTGMEAGSVVYTPTQRTALTVDYAANIAAGLQILVDKWNQMKQLGVSVNDGDPSKIENWWYALWAYNSGWHLQGGDPSGVYGLGWGNNVANEDFPADRLGFLDAGFGDAKFPNHWAYPERVLGWAHHPLLRLNWKTGEYGQAYVAARWTNNSPVRPPLGSFCTSAVQCDMDQIHKPSQYPEDPGSHCLRDDLKCWWHVSTTWTVCASSCGAENITYPPGTAEPSFDGKILYPQDCSGRSQLPVGALVIDDVPTSVTTQRSCQKDWDNHGTLSFKFAADAKGNFPSKIDFHQVDGGFGGHMWSAHTWTNTPGNAKHKVTGTWTLDQQINGWARVLVYVPDHRAGTPQAFYTVNGSDSEAPSRSVVEGNYLDDDRRPASGRWVSIGAFNFSGIPSVSLDNMTHAGVDSAWVDDLRDVPWDAVAFEKLPGKPTNQVVALGDSYASGEGASSDPVRGAWAYLRSSDHDGRDGSGDDNRFRDACHRSPWAWSRQARLPDSTESIGYRSDNFDQSLDYHMSACSGAVAQNLRSGGSGQYQEGPQPDQGYLDQNTTLVTLSVGGNDAKFTPIIQECVVKLTGLCQNSTLPGDPEPLVDWEPKRINNEVRPAIESALNEIHSKARNAKILVMGYPKLLDAGGSCILGLGTSEYPWLVEMGNVLDEAIRTAAHNAHAAGIEATFADPRTAFEGKGACSQNAQIHGVVLALTRGDDKTELWPGHGVTSAQTLHPTVEGATTYAGVATAAFREM